MNAALIACTTVLCCANTALVAVAVLLCRSQDALLKLLSDDYGKMLQTPPTTKPKAIGMYRNVNKEEDKT